MRVGIVGLGLMGSTMAVKLVEAMDEVSVWNRTKEKAGPALEKGARWCESPAEVAESSDVVITMLTDPAAVTAVTFGEHGIAAGLCRGSVHADMSTISPKAAADNAQAYVSRSGLYVQAPVLGSVTQIRNGTLLIFAGGSIAAIDKCRPVWSALSSKIWNFDSAEEAATTKLCCNMLIAHMVTGLAQSLLLAKKGGVPPSKLLDILSNSALGNPMFASKGAAILNRNFNANFVVRNLLKDLNLISDAAAQTGVPLPAHGLIRELFVAAVQLGYGEEDYSAVVKVLEGLAGAEISD